MKIYVFNKQKDLKLSSKSARAIVRAVIDHEKADFTEVGLYFVSEKKIGELHDQFFNDPTPTDCISFPLSFGGEVFVCPKTALLYADQHQLDPYEEAALYIVHGLLHLMGYDDLEEKARRIMRKKEKSCMNHLKDLKILLRPPF